MKKILLLLALSASNFHSNAQSCGQILSSGILPANPTSTQEEWLNLQAYCNVGYYLNTYTINQVGSTFYVDAYYCENMLQVITYTNDSIPLGILPQGSYACFVNVYSSSDGCVSYAQTDQVALNWDVVLDCAFAVSLQPIDQVVAPGGTATFTSDAIGTTAYQWQTDNVGSTWVNLVDNASFSGTTTSTLTVSNVQAGNNGQGFRLALTGAGNECSDTSMVAFITVDDSLSSINELQSLNWTIYPNPAQDYLTIEGLFPEDTRMVLMNIYGQVMLHEKLNSPTHAFRFPVHLSSGSYFVRLQSPSGVLLGTKRVIKE